MWQSLCGLHCFVWLLRGDVRPTHQESVVLEMGVKASCLLFVSRYVVQEDHFRSSSNLYESACIILTSTMSKSINLAVHVNSRTKNIQFYILRIPCLISGSFSYTSQIPILNGPRSDDILFAALPTQMMQIVLSPVFLASGPQ